MIYRNSTSKEIAYKIYKRLKKKPKNKWYTIYDFGISHGSGLYGNNGYSHYLKAIKILNTMQIIETKKESKNLGFNLHKYTFFKLITNRENKKIESKIMSFEIREINYGKTRIIEIDEEFKKTMNKKVIFLEESVKSLSKAVKKLLDAKER